MGCISGIDDSNGSTPRAEVTVITEMNVPIRKKASDSASGDSFIVLERVGPIECLVLCNELIFS
jgi:hypothetical protein